MTYYAYNAFLRFSGAVTDPADAHERWELTTKAPPLHWPDGVWPYFVDGEWELVEVQRSLAL